MSEAQELEAYGPPLRQRILDALALLGGTATTLEIHAGIEASGYPVPYKRVPTRLNDLARENPPQVTALGDPCQGPGVARTWRLGAPEADGTDPEPRFPARGALQPPAAGRAPLCPECLYLKDSVGHFWAHGGLRGRLR